MHTPRTLALALVFTFLMCSMFVGCSGSTVPPEQTDVVKRDTAGACGDNVWLPTGGLANARENATAVRLANGTVIVAGGLWMDPNDPTLTGPVAAAERYNPTAGTWSAAGTLHVPRYGHRAVGLKDASGNVTKVLVVGGTTENGDPTETAEIYDSGTNSWTQVASMNSPRYFPQVTVLADGRRVLVSGGQGVGFQTLKSAEVFDSTQNAWQNVGDMHAERLAAGSALLSDGRVLVAGGSYNFTHLSSAEIYDPVAKTWATTTSMSVGRYTLGLVTLKNGKVLAVGGSDDLPGAEVYDPAARTWTATTGMNHPSRYLFETIPLADGRVMVAGGTGAEGLLDSVELYDADLSQWLPNNPMNEARYLGASTELLDGRILVATGYVHESTGAENDSGAAETFVPCPPDRAPVALCKNVTVDLTDRTPNTCVTPPGAATSVDNGSYDPDDQPGPWQVFQWAPPPYVGLGAHPVTLIASDGLLQSGCSATVTVNDKAKPNVTCPTNVTLECNNGNGGATAPTFTASVTDNCGGGTSTCTGSGKTFGLGTTTTSCTATDGSGNTDTCTFNVTVQDTTPPVTGASKNIVLWPADGALHEITLMDCANFTVDACHGRLNPLNFNGGIITKVTADEPDDVAGSNRDGNTTGDISIKKPWLALVRAERDTTRNGRVYTVHYQVTDSSNNTTPNDATCKVFVPVNQGSQAIDDQTVSNCVPAAGFTCP